MITLKSEIKWINNSSIDRTKWDACIDQCAWGNIYALSWYLDIITDNSWEAMVIGDYEYIMPVPFRKKFGIKYTYRPNFCQQLGVFSKTEIPQTTLSNFINELLIHYHQIHYPFNYANKIGDFIGDKLKLRTNLILNLSNSYENVYANFSDGLKKSLKSASKAVLTIDSTIAAKDIITLHKKSWKSVVHIPELDYTNFQKIIARTTISGQSECLGLYSNGVLLGACAILKYKNRIYYPLSAVANEGRKHAAVAVLINSILKKYSNSDLMFDFEGSDIASVKTFYKRFNPTTEVYYQIDKTIPLLNKLSALLRSITNK